MKGIIYLVTNKINGKKYVGQTIQKWPYRKNKHFNSSNPYSIIDKALQKYGKENFKWEILEKNMDNQKNLNLLEKFWIIYFKTRTFEWGYNIKEGGSNGSYSKESKLKMSKSQTGKKHSKETKIKISEGHKLENRSKLYKKRSSRSKWTNEYPGAYYRKGANDGTKCWQCKIGFNKSRFHFGNFHDPVSASICYMLIWNEIYGK